MHNEYNEQLMNSRATHRIEDSQVKKSPCKFIKGAQDSGLS